MMNEKTREQTVQPTSFWLRSGSQDAAALVGVWLVHFLVTGYILLHTEVPLYFDGANHYNLVLLYCDTLHNFQPTWGWLVDLGSVSSYYPPFFHVTTALPLYWFGASIDLAKSVNLIWLGVLMAGVYALGCRLYDRRVGVFAGVLVSFFPVVSGLTRDLLVDLALLALAAWGVWLVLKTEGFRKPGWSFIFGLVAACGILTKWTYPVFLAGPVLYVMYEAFVRWDLGTLSKTLTGWIQRHQHQPAPQLLLGLGLWVLVVFLVILLASPIPVGVRIVVGALLFPVGFLWLSWVLVWAHRFLAAPFEVFPWHPQKPWRVSLVNMLLAGVPILLLAVPWFVAHHEYISFIGRSVMTDAAIARDQPSPLTLPGMFYYLVTLQSHTLGFLFFILFLVGLWYGARSGVVGAGGYLVVWFLLSYAITTALRIQDPKYFMPILYIPPLLIAAAVLRWAEQGKQWVPSAVCIGAVVVFLHTSFGLPVLRVNRPIETPIGTFYLTRRGVYGAEQLRIGELPMQSIIDTITADSAEVPGPRPIQVATLVDDGFIQAAGFNNYAQTQGNAVWFFNPVSFNDPIEYQLHRVLQAPYIITKDIAPEDGYIALPFVWRYMRELYEEVLNPDSPFFGNLQRLGMWELPPSQRGHLRVWKNTMVLDGERAWTPIAASFQDTIQMTAWQTPRRAVLPGESVFFFFQWYIHSPELYTELLDHCHLYLHLYSLPRGDYVPGAARNYTGVLNEYWLPAPDRPLHQFPLHTTDWYAMKLPDDLPAGEYEVRVGIFNLDKHAQGDPDFRLSVFREDQRVTPDLTLPGAIRVQPAGWEIANTTFSDHLSQPLLTLLSYHLHPTQTHPGAQVSLECVWRPYDLLALRNLRQNHEFFVHLYPQNVSGVTGNVAAGEFVWGINLPFSDEALHPHHNPDTRTLREVYSFELPWTLPDDEYVVRIGVWNPAISNPHHNQLAIFEQGQPTRTDLRIVSSLMVTRPGWQEADWTFDEYVNLLRYRFVPEVLSASGRFTLEVWWSVPDPSHRQTLHDQYRFFVHLYPSQSNLHAPGCAWNNTFLDGAQTILSPKLSSLQPEDYPVGVPEPILERYSMQLPSVLAPGEYRVEVGLYDETTEQRLLVFDPRRNQMVNQIELTPPVQVIAEDDTRNQQ